MRIKSYIISCGLLAIQLCAVDPTWQVGGTNTNWGTNNNWSTGTPPDSVSITADFNDLGAQSVTFTGTAYSIGTLSFNTTTLYTFTGAGGLNILTAITSTGTQDPTINCPLLLSGTVSITSGSLLSGVTLGGAISGTGGLSVVDLSDLILTGSSNTYTGDTTIGNGASLAASVSSLSSSSTIIFGGTSATLTLNGGCSAASISSGTTGNNGDIVLTGGSLTLVNPEDTYKGVISGTGGLSLTGGIGLTISSATGNLNYSGTTTIQNSVLSAGALDPFSHASLVTTQAGGTFDLNGFNAQIANLSGTAGTVNLRQNTLTLGDATSLSAYTGSIISSGNGWQITKQGSGTFSFSDLNTTSPSITYTGTLTINGGTATPSARGAIASNTSVAVASGATFDVSAADNTIGALNGAGAVSLGGSTLTIIGGGIFSGTTTQSAGGNLTVTSGSLVLNSTTTIAPLLINGGTVTLSGANITITSLSGNAGTLGLGVASAVIGAPNATSTTYSGDISGANPFNFTGTGTGTLILGGTQKTYTGATNINGGVLQIGASSILPSATALTVTSPGTFNLDTFSQQVATLAGTGTVNLGSGSTLTVGGGTYTGSITGAGGLTIAGGTFTLSGSAKAFTGLTTLQNSAILQGGVANSFSPVSTVVFSSGAQLQLNGFGNTIGNLRSTVGGTVALGSNVLTLYGSSAPSVETYYGTFTGAGGLTVNFQNTGSSLTLMTASAGLSSVPVIVTQGSLVFGATNSIGSLSGAGGVVSVNSGVVLSIAGSGTYAGSITGAGGVTLNGTSQTLTGTVNNYTGTTTVNAGATLFGGVQANTMPFASLISLTTGTLNLNGFDNEIARLSGSGTVTLGANRLTITNPQDIFNGSIGGTGGISLTGGIGLVISSVPGALNYSGDTIINNSTLQVGSSGFLSSSSVVDVQADGILNLGANAVSVANLKGADSSAVVNLATGSLAFGNGVNTTYSGKIISSSTIPITTPSFTKNGGGALTLSGTGNTYYGLTTINNAGILLASSAGALSPNSAITLANTAQLTNNANNSIVVLVSATSDTGTQLNLASGTTLALNGVDVGIGGTFAGKITGNGGLDINCGGTWTLWGAANDYSGPTTVIRTTLAADAVGAFSPASAVTLGDGTFPGTAQLSLGTFSNTILSLTGDQYSSVNLGGGAAILTMGDSTITTFAGAITGTGTAGILKQGSGTLSLTGTNNYSGSTQISAGTLKGGAVNALAPASNVIIIGQATLDISPTGADNTIGALNSGATTAHVTLGANTLTIAGTTTSSYAGTILGTGGITNSANTFTLAVGSGAAYTGPTSINGGSFIAADAGLLAPGSDVVMNGSGAATLDITAGSNTIASLSGTDTQAVVSLGASTLTLAADNTNNNFYGQITGTGGSLTKNGKGFLTLYNSSSNYSGTTTINAGSLRAGNPNVFSPSSAVVLGSSATLDLRSHNNTILTLSGGGAVVLGTGTLTLANPNGEIYSGVISSLTTQSGGITKQETGTFTIAGACTYGGLTTISAGNITASGPYVLSPNSTFNMNGGTLTLDANPNIIGSLKGTTNVTLGGGLLTFGGNNDSSATTYSGVISGAGGIKKTGTQTLVLSGQNTYTGGTTISGGGALSISADDGLGATSPGNDLTLDNGTLIVTGPLAQVSVSRNIVLQGNGILQLVTGMDFGGVFSGPGTLTVNGYLVITYAPQTYTGQTFLNATLQANVGNAFSPNSEITIGTSGSLQLNTHLNQIANLSGTGGTVLLDYGVLTLGNANSTTYAGSISGPGGITKVGSGVLNLTGSGGYSPTLIQEGTVAFNGPFTTNVTVSLGATLAGAGTITGNVTNNGTVSPGNSIGTLSIVGAFTQAAGSTYEVEISPTLSDLITTTGAFTISPGANLDVSLLRGYYAPNQEYTVIDALGGISGTFTNVTAGSDRIAVVTQYTSTLLNLFITVKNFTDLVLGENARNVANVIDSLNKIDPPEWDSVLDGLFGLPIADVEGALNQLDPAQLKGLSIIQQNNAVRVQNGISLRFQNLLDKMNCAELECCREKRSPVYLWVDAFNSRLRQPSNFIDTNPQVGYHSNTGGGSVGLDVNFLKTGYIGLVGGGTYSDIQWVSGQGKGHITSGYFGLYGSVIGEKKFVNMSLLGATNKYGAFRNIIYPGMDATAISEHKGLQLLSHVDAGLNFTYYGFTIRPFDSMDYIIQHEDAFQEYNAGVLSLDVQSTSPQIFRNELGINFARCMSINKQSRLIADIKLSWVNESRFNGTYFASNFINYADLPFEAAGYYPNRNFFAPAATLTFNFFHDSSYITISYDAEIGHHYFDQRTSVQLGLHF